MRAYFAILKDSYREAAASMVLWLALGGILLLLLVLAPVGLVTSVNTKLRYQELVDPEKFVQALVDGQSKAKTPEGHFWSKLNAQQQERFVAFTRSDDRSGARGSRHPGSGRFLIVNAINGLLEKPDFYDPVAFESVELDEDLRSTDADSLSAEERTNKNLRRLEQAFSRYVSVSERSALSMTYAGFDLTGPLPILPSQIKPIVDFYLSWMLWLFLGFGGVFAALLFTATLIPRTFEPGEISLLLSKPVHRSFLFLTKFFGGCVFTLVCASLLVTGLWLLLGLRLSMWRIELFWCIPVYIFLFAIFFSVSAFLGAVWRNAIVSLILVISFWFGLTVVGIAHSSMNEFVVKNRRVTEIASNGGQVFAVDGSRSVHRWNSAVGDWIPVQRAESNEKIPAFLQRLVFSGNRFRVSVSHDGQQILALQPTLSRMGGIGPSMVLSGHAAEEYELQPELQTPESMFGIFQTPEGEAILPGTRGVYRFVGQTEQERKAQTFFKSILGGLLSSTSKTAFETLTEKDFPLITTGSSVAFNPTNSNLVALNAGEIRRIDRTADGKYVAGVSKDLQWKESAILAIGANLLVIARADGKVLAMDAGTLDQIAESSLPAGETPRVVECSADGRSAAVLTHRGTVLVYDDADHKFLSWAPRESGYASAIAFDENSRLMVVDHHRSVRIYDVATQSSVDQLLGSVDLPCRIFDYVLSPVYTVLPKPGDLDNAVQWILTGEKSVAIENDAHQAGNIRANLEAERVTFNVWNAILSNLAFITVMLGLGCLYIARSDF